MSAIDTDRLVQQVIQLTGAAPPRFMEGDSPALEQSGQSGGIYLIGLIGGKEVGKSALVNALAGQSITEPTSHGPGTQIAVAYVHKDHQAELAELLEKIVPGEYRIVTHDNSRLGRQVLLDLPDIDSRFSRHLEVTRRALRHMLYPIWLCSVEKYADAQPQQLLSRVAAGNDPANFLFCLNKVDQLPEQNGQATELRDDYARRLEKLLGLPSAPRVFMISAIQPGAFDLPELAKLLAREKSTADVEQSRKLAVRRRRDSLLVWLDAQNLPARAEQLRRLEDEASELISQRVGVPLLERILPEILDDPSYRAFLTDGVLARRVGRWPIVNILHGALSPLRMLVRENAATSGTFFGGAQALVDGHFPAAGESVARSVQSAFAQLHGSHPNLPQLYERKKLWDSMEAEQAEGRLRTEMVQTIERQRKMVMDKLSGRAGIISPFFRVLLTIGALIWFPVIQPILHLILTGGAHWKTAADVGMLLVEIFSAQSLLQNAVFLLLWYLLIWALLRWDTRRRVDRLLKKWKSVERTDPGLSLAACALGWLDDLLDPIRAALRIVEDLADRIAELRKEEI